MTQKAVFSKQMIVETAFELTHAEGWQAVTARNIARKLSSSTMPIYSGWKSMVGIEQEVRRRAESLMVEYQRKAYTADQALNAAFGYVTFARDERHLFRFLYVDRPLPAEIRGNNPPVKVTPEGVTSGRAVPAWRTRSRWRCRTREFSRAGSSLTGLPP